MTSAVYGRMQIGRCAPQDFGHIGCRNDALAQLDRECSGRRSCSVEVTNRFGTSESGACLPFVTGYLETNHDCAEGKIPYSPEQAYLGMLISWRMCKSGRRRLLRRES